MTDYTSPHNGRLIKTIGNQRPQMAMTVEHVLLLPELCPASKNPKPGSSVTVRYEAGARLLELFSLDQYIDGFVGHRIVRDIEFFTQVVGEDCANALGQAVEVFADIELNAVRQRQKVSLTARPTPGSDG